MKKHVWFWLGLPAGIAIAAAVTLLFLKRVDGILVLGNLGPHHIELVVWAVLTAALGGLVILTGAFVRRYKRRLVRFLGGSIIALGILGMIPAGGLLFWGAVFSSAHHYTRLDGPTAGRSLMVESLTWGETQNDVYEGDGILYSSYSLAHFQTAGTRFNPFESGQYKIANVKGTLTLWFAEYDGGPLSRSQTIADRGSAR